MKKNLWILLKCIVVIVMLVNLPYPKVYSESQVEIASKQEEQDEITQTVNKSNGKSIYIYNTHQTEEYSKTTLAEYSVSPNVSIVDYIMEDILEKSIMSYLEGADGYMRFNDKSNPKELATVFNTSKKNFKRT